MLEEIVKTIGWNGLDDRDTRIRKAQILDAIPKLQILEDQISMCGRDLRDYIEKKGITTPRDVLVILRRLAKKQNHHILYERASKNINNIPQYLYYLI
jgi:hypothetical protein